MSSSLPNLSIWAGNEVVVVRISGRAGFQSSVDFKATMHGLWARGYTRFILDLTKCQLMDSTFLGVMAGLGLKFSRETNCAGTATLELLNPNARIADLFENLGIAHLFRIVTSPDFAVNGLTPVEHEATTPDRLETTRTCLEAHKLLMQLNEANVPKFKDVTKFLEEDLNRMDMPMSNPLHPVPPDR